MPEFEWLAVPALTATLAAGYHTDSDYGEMFGRLNAFRVHGPWQASLRLDTATFIDAPDPVDSRYTLEKASAAYTGRSVEVTAGDAYLSFGRGLSLSLRKLDELGVDTTIRGTKVLVHHGDLGGTLAFGYANINNVDEATGTSVDDPYDLVGGAQGQITLGDRLTAGAYGAGVAFHDALGLVPNDRYTDRVGMAGVTLDAPQLTPELGFYLEAMGQRVSTDPAAEDDTGFALYGTGTAYLGKTTLLLEGKAYGNLVPLHPRFDEPAFSAVTYNSPPTVERVVQIIENPARRIGGARVRADYNVSPALITYVNYGAFVDWQGYADPDTGEVRPGIIHDPYAGGEVRWDDARSWAIASAGWRAVLLEDSNELVRGDAHGELDLSQALNDCVSLTFHGVHVERTKRESVILDEQFREGTLTAGVRLQPALSAAAGYDYTTEPTQPRTHNFNGNLGWDITPSSSLRLFAGAARGGLRCVSGVCRIVPPFEGIKLTATLRF